MGTNGKKFTRTRFDGEAILSGFSSWEISVEEFRSDQYISGRVC